MKSNMGVGMEQYCIVSNVLLLGLQHGPSVYQVKKVQKMNNAFKR